MKLKLALLAAAALLAACATAPSNFSYSPPLLPEGASGYAEKPGWATRKFAVAAANPLATDAGYQVLKAGGSAIDAAIAVQMVLTLVEPQSSGIGGGAFLLHYNGKDVEAFDGRETAPAAADEKLFLGADGKPLAFYDARGRRPFGRRARHGAHAGDGAPAIRQAALGQAVRAGHRAGRRRLQGQPAPEHAGQGRRAPEEGSRGRRLLLQARRRAARRRLQPAQPRTGSGAAQDRGRRLEGACTKARSRRPSSTRCRGTRPTPAR